MTTQDSMQVSAIKTRNFCLYEDLEKFIRENLEAPLKENSILAVTSKVVSLSEGCVSEQRICDITDKTALIQAEADHYLGKIGYDCHLTIKHGLFIPSSGIDESNSETGRYILFPKDPYKSAKDLCIKLKNFFGLSSFGVLITDSHTTPLRKGVTGIALSYWGFNGVRSLVGTEDLFGRPLKMTNMNLVDGLAATAVLMMGEGAESRPISLIEGAPVEFINSTDKEKLMIDPKEDLYNPLYKNLLK